MKKVISKIPMIKTNKLRKRGMLILGCLFLILLILSYSVIKKENINKYILKKTPNEAENYNLKIEIKQGANALTKEIGESIKTSINKKQPNMQEICIKEMTIPEEKSNISKQTTTYNEQVNESNQKTPNYAEGQHYIEEQQGAPMVVKWDKVTASSELNSGDGYYKASLVNDGNPNTAWVEGKDGDGIGEWIKLESNTPRIIDAVGFSNGYQKSRYAYNSNNRPKKVRVELSDGTSKTQDLVDRFGGNEVYFGREISTTYVKVTILEVYKGSKYQDTCISDIDAYH